MKSACELESTLSQIHHHLEALTSSPSTELNPLFEAARYSLLSGGKRLRPLLVLSLLQDYGHDPSKGLDAACALEMVHTYSLIHDDLPCMDDDDLRRGLPTLHKVVPEGHAVLAGDFLLTLAFDTLAHATGLSEGQRLKLIQLLARHAGAEGMVGGQIIDLTPKPKGVSWNYIEKMHAYKTASLIQCALQFAGVIAEVSDSELQRLNRIGYLLGVAFQIVDDLLDHFGDEAIMGKKTGSDALQNKVTALTLCGAEGCKKMVSDLEREISQEMHDLKTSAKQLQALISQALNREK